jgi:hypothetical protein
VINFNKHITIPLSESRLDTVSMILGFIFKKVLVQNYILEPIVFKGLNNSEVTLSASIAKSESHDLHLSTLDRDIKLKGKTMDTPTGGDTWV